MGADMERRFDGAVARGREVDRPENASHSQYAPVYLTCPGALSAAQRNALLRRGQVRPPQSPIKNIPRRPNRLGLDGSKRGLAGPYFPFGK